MYTRWFLGFMQSWSSHKKKKIPNIVGSHSSEIWRSFVWYTASAFQTSVVKFKSTLPKIRTWNNFTLVRFSNENIKLTAPDRFQTGGLNEKSSFPRQIQLSWDLRWTFINIKLISIEHFNRVRNAYEIFCD